MTIPIVASAALISLPIPDHRAVRVLLPRVHPSNHPSEVHPVNRRVRVAIPLRVSAAAVNRPTPVHPAIQAHRIAVLPARLHPHPRVPARAVPDRLRAGHRAVVRPVNHRIQGKDNAPIPSFVLSRHAVGLFDFITPGPDF